MKKNILSLLIVFLSLISVNSNFVSAQESSASAGKKVKLQFPIAELGNCASLQECKTYCDDVSNQEACITFAKQKGIYKQKQTQNDSSLVQLARTELGCDSISACREFCSLEENIAKCREFAQKHSLKVNSNNSSGNALLERAKQILGCDSMQSCKVYCQLHIEECRKFKGEENNRPASGAAEKKLLERRFDGSSPAVLKDKMRERLRREPSGFKVLRPSGQLEIQKPPENSDELPPPQEGQNEPTPLVQEQEVRGISTERSFIDRVFGWFLSRF